MENKNLVKILIGIIVALVLIIGSIVIGGGIYYIISTKNKLNEMEKTQKEQEKRQLENQMMASIQTQPIENNKKIETKTNEPKAEVKEVDPYEKRFTASDMNNTLVEIKGVRDGNRVLVQVLEGRNKNKKGYINLKGFKNISNSSLRKLIGSTWAASGINNGVEMEYGLILHQPDADIDQIYSYNLNKTLIENGSGVTYDCGRDTARNFVQTYDASACY
ncbi:hypothetical protein [Leptotrichia buccalis]|uniref:Uncharacterized protein n=1 Tax=Leptotrichia buccalis (strain ATCC 14201 / DSM 1135 / JCM 12969 / NCTC 10249 / C-1013-b) TaxID=523794 RepID=C7N961_LEPBD|nr:hypothetical protein [Leptotrichia buccalis]ACV38692.1 hypothetical protein Lebu_0784 [Leptotrichia buccalis C-1013-b]